MAPSVFHSGDEGVVSVLVAFAAVPTEEHVPGGTLLMLSAIPTSQPVLPDEGDSSQENHLMLELLSRRLPLSGIPRLPITTVILVFVGFFPRMGVYNSGARQLQKARPPVLIFSPRDVSFAPHLLGDHAKFSSELPFFHVVLQTVPRMMPLSQLQVLTETLTSRFGTTLSPRPPLWTVSPCVSWTQPSGYICVA